MDRIFAESGQLAAKAIGGESRVLVGSRSPSRSSCRCGRDIPAKARNEIIEWTLASPVCPPGSGGPAPRTARRLSVPAPYSGAPAVRSVPPRSRCARPVLRLSHHLLARRRGLHCELRAPVRARARLQGGPTPSRTGGSCLGGSWWESARPRDRGAFGGRRCGRGAGGRAGERAASGSAGRRGGPGSRSRWLRESQSMSLSISSLTGACDAPTASSSECRSGLTSSL